MNKTKRFSISLAIGLLISYMVNVVMWLLSDFASRGLFVLESTLLWTVLSQSSQLFMPGQLNVRLAMLRVQMGSVDHSHGSALHWSVSLLGGFVISAIIGQTFTGGVPWNLSNWLINFPIYIIPFVFGTALIYYFLLEH